jgi:predicted porin
MKKTLIAAAVLATVGTSALAQSSVTVYGRVNVTIERQKLIDDEKNTSMVNNASRIGFRGVEDLGGGLKAGFQIEHGFNINNGTQSQSAFWARQSEVNLSGGFGMVRLGNFTSEAYYATADYVGLHNHDTGTSADALYAYLGRNTSKVAYRTPSFGGVTIEAAVTEAGSNPNRTIDLAANYDVGSLHLGAGYERDGSQRNQFAFRALYELGAFTIGGYVQRDKNGYLPAAQSIDPTVTSLGSRTTFRIAGMYTLGASEFHLSFGRAGDYGDVEDSAASQIVVAYNYNLSKRTKVQAFYSRLSGDGDDAYAAFNVGGVRNAFGVGVRHNF